MKKYRSNLLETARNRKEATIRNMIPLKYVRLVEVRARSLPLVEFR